MTTSIGSGALCTSPKGETILTLKCTKQVKFHNPQKDHVE